MDNEIYVSGTKKARGARVTENQLSSMVNFMESNKSLATGKFQGINEKDALRKKWDELTIHLNGLKGAQKNSTQWQVVCIISVCNFKKRE